MSSTSIEKPTSPPPSTSTSTKSAPLFKKKRGRGGPSASSNSSDATTTPPSRSLPINRSIHRAEYDDDEDDDSSASTVVHKARKIDPSNPLVQSTGVSLAKRRARERAAAAEEELEEEQERDDEYSAVSARVKAGASSGASKKLGADATRSVNWYDEDDEDGKSKDRGSATAAANNDDGVYRGLSSYSSAVATDPAASKNKYTQRGPIKAPTNIRTVTVVDYQPDVCKDYKETGYCGFGDTCKFLHDRSDYLAGWQMEAAYLPNSTARNLGHNEEGEDSDDEEEGDIPFACLICRQPFTDPIQTKCGHYFCSACAIKRFAKTPKCFACGAQTGGIFNSAQKIISRMEKRKSQKEEEKRRKRAEWGHEERDGGEDDDGQILEGVDVRSASESGREE